MRMLLITVAVATILSGCKSEMPLYVSDLQDLAAATETKILAAVTLSMELESCDGYDSIAEEVPEFAADTTTGVMSGFRTLGCMRNEFGYFVQAEAQIPIVTDPQLWRQMASGLAVLVGQHGGNIVVTLVADQHKKEVLRKRLNTEKTESRPTLDTPTEAEIYVILTNDVRSVQTYIVEDVFLDGLAITDPQRFELQRRQTAEIRLSNVAASRLATHGAVHVLILESPPQLTTESGEESSLPPPAAVASTVPAPKVPLDPRSVWETAAAHAALEASVSEAYYVALGQQVSTIAARSYPRRSIDLGEEGTVVLLIRVREDGSVIDIAVEEGRTNASLRLQRAAQRAVLRAAPFERLPAGAGAKSILLPVIYRITESQDREN